MLYVVYLILNTENGKMYVGQTTKTVEQRFKKHCLADSPLGRAIRLHGAKKFRYDVIKTCVSKAEVDAWEKFFIAALRCKVPNGYNCTDGGEGTAGWKHRPETCKKISEALKGEKHPLFGKHLTPEACKKISDAHSGEKNHFFGKHHTPETCKKIAAALIGRFCGEKNPFFGKHHKPEIGAKSSAAQRGYSPFKNLLRELDARQLTYNALAKLMGLCRKSVSAKMCGKIRFTDSDKVKLVEIFGKSIEYLLARDDG